MPRREASLATILAGSKSASFRRLNAGLFAPDAVGKLRDSVAQQARLNAAGGANTGEGEGKAGVGIGNRGSGRGGAGNGNGGHPGVRVRLVSFRKPGRALDDDNLRGGCKTLRDSVAAWLGLDDAEQFIAWEYAQCETRGRRGTAVIIEIIPALQTPPKTFPESR